MPPDCPNPNCRDPRPHEHVAVADPDPPGAFTTGTRTLEPLTDSRQPIIRRALLVASETRLTDLCYLLECTTREAEIQVSVP